MITAFEASVANFAEVQRNLPVRAAILQREHLPRFSPHQHDGITRKADRVSLTQFEFRAARHGIPEIRIEAGLADVARQTCVVCGEAHRGINWHDELWTVTWRELTSIAA